MDDSFPNSRLRTNVRQKAMFRSAHCSRACGGKTKPPRENTHGGFLGRK